MKRGHNQPEHWQDSVLPPFGNEETDITFNPFKINTYIN